MIKKLMSLGFLAMVAFGSCSDDNEPAPGDGGNLKIEFDARVGTQNLQLGNTTYQNALGQDYEVDVLRYYISNIRLKKTDDTWYEDPLSEDGSEGYYLIDDSNQGSTIITLDGVPFDSYTEMEFVIGVDANRVSQGAQTGALDPVNNLFWSWNAGYIFLQIEGTAPVSTEEGNVFFYHVGGYKTDPAMPNLANNIKTKTVTFGGEEANVSSSSEPEIHIIVDVEKFFEGTTNVDFSTNSHCHVPSCGTVIANNYESTFIFDHLHQ